MHKIGISHKTFANKHRFHLSQRTKLSLPDKLALNITKTSVGDATEYNTFQM